MRKILSILLLGFVITGCQSVAVKEQQNLEEIRDTKSFNIDGKGETITTLLSLITKDKISADTAAKKVCKNYTFFPNYIQLDNGLKRYNVQCEFHMIK